MPTLTRLRRILTCTVGLAVVPVLASCSQTASPPAAPSAAATSTTTATATAPSAASSAAPSASSGPRVDITVKGKRVSPAPATVSIAVGQTLTITVTSDRDNTLHAHGFEVEKAVRAGQRLEFTVKGSQSGSYEVELHEPALRLLQVAVR